MVEQVVGLEFVTSGEREIVSSIARVDSAQKKLQATSNALAQAQKRNAGSEEAVIKAYLALERSGLSYSDVLGGLRQDSQMAQKSAQQYNNALLGVDKAHKSAKSSADVFRTAMKANETALEQQVAETKQAAAADAALAREKDRLIQKLNPLRSASMLYEKELRDINEATRLGAINDRQRQQSLDALNAEFQAFSNGAQGAAMANNRFGVQSQMAGRNTNQLGVLMQQTGYQVGDFAVQVQGGTNVLVALGQQATQLVGTFGMLSKSTRMIGVFAGLGILIPILTGVGAYFLRMRDSANEAAKAADTLGESIKSLDSTLADFVRTRKAAEAGVTVDELLGTESLEKASADLAEAEARLNRLVVSSQTTPIGLFAGVAVIDYIKQARAIKGTEAALLDVIAARTRLQLLEERAASERAETFVTESAELSRQIELQRLSLRFGSDSAQVRAAEVEQQIIALRKREDIEEGAKGHIEAQIRLSAQLAEEIIQAEAATESVADATRELTYEMSMAANEALRFVSNLESGGGVNAARARIAGLRAELGARQGGAGDIEAAAARAEAEVRARPEFQLALTGPEGLRQETLAGLNREVEAARLNAEAGMISSEISGLGRTPDTPSGGGSGQTPITENVYLEQLRQEVEQKRRLSSLSEKQRSIEERVIQLQGQAQAQQLTISNERLRFFAIEEQRIADQMRLQDVFSSNIDSALMSLVQGTQSVEDAFNSMLRNIILAIYKQQVVDPIAQGAGSFLSSLFFANGAAFSNGNVVPFANGGVVGSPTTFPMAGGKTGLMGEAGPEAIMPLKRGKDGKLGVAADGGGAVTVNNYFTVQANGDDSVKRIVRQQIPQIAEATKAAVVDAKRRGGSYGRAFG